MTELRSVACLLSATSARFVKSSQTATGSAASSTAIRRPVSTETRMSREILFSMAAFQFIYVACAMLSSGMARVKLSRHVAGLQLYAG